MRFFPLLVLLALLLLSNCEKDDPQPPAPNPGSEKGTIITSEGLFNQGNASLSFYDFEKGELEKDVFLDANGRPLGDILQSITVVENTGYLMLNNSQRVEVIDLRTFESQGSITGLTSPRYLLPVNDTLAYVSDLFGGVIYLVNLAKNEVEGTVSMTQGWTEQMVKVGSEAFVACPTSFGQPASEYLYVIDTENHRLTDSIKVGNNPVAAVTDKNDQLWVLCAGDSFSGEIGGIYRVDPAAKVATLSLPFDDTNISFAPRLAIHPDGSSLYYTKDGLYKMDIEATALPAEALIPAAGRELYGLGIEPATGNIWLSDAGDFQSAGTVFSYSSDGQLLETIEEVGFLPNGFVFR